MTSIITPRPAHLRAMQSGDPRGFTQRWRYGTPTWRHVSEGGFRAQRYAVTAIPEATAKAFVQRHHYLSGWPAVLHRPYGLLDQEASLNAGDLAVEGLPLVGVLVLASPMNPRVLTGRYSFGLGLRLFAPARTRKCGSGRRWRPWGREICGTTVCTGSCTASVETDGSGRVSGWACRRSTPIRRRQTPGDRVAGPSADQFRVSG